MGYFKAQIVLMKLARLTEQKQSSFSKQEIISKINEIKYLSAQKKVPKLTLRKEILHLENKLTSILDLEKSVLKNKKQESVKVTALKRQITYLKRQLAACTDKNLNQKVDQLSHMLGDSLAHIDSSKNAKLTEQVQNKIKGKEKNNLALFQVIIQRLTALRHDLQAEQEKDPEKIQAIQDKMYALSQKLKEYQDKHPECKIQGIELESRVTPEQVQHEIIFHESVTGLKQTDLDSAEENQELEKELPLPPPPRMK